MAGARPWEALAPIGVTERLPLASDPAFAAGLVTSRVTGVADRVLAGARDALPVTLAGALEVTPRVRAAAPRTLETFRAPARGDVRWPAVSERLAEPFADPVGALVRAPGDIAEFPAAAAARVRSVVHDVREEAASQVDALEARVPEAVADVVEAASPSGLDAWVAAARAEAETLEPAVADIPRAALTEVHHAIPSLPEAVTALPATPADLLAIGRRAGATALVEALAQPPDPAAEDAAPATAAARRVRRQAVTALHETATTAAGPALGIDSAAAPHEAAPPPGAAARNADTAGPPAVHAPAGVATVVSAAEAPAAASGVRPPLPQAGGPPGASSLRAPGAPGTHITPSHAAPAQSTTPPAEPAVDDIAGHVYERVRARLRADLLIDRERAGRLADTR